MQILWLFVLIYSDNYFAFTWKEGDSTGLQNYDCVNLCQKNLSLVPYFDHKGSRRMPVANDSDNADQTPREAEPLETCVYSIRPWKYCISLSFYWRFSTINWISVETPLSST